MSSVSGYEPTPARPSQGSAKPRTGATVEKKRTVALVIPSPIASLRLTTAALIPPLFYFTNGDKCHFFW